MSKRVETEPAKAADVLASSSTWSAGQNPEQHRLELALPGQGVRWFDLAQSSGSGAVLELLGPVCQGLTSEMVEDLLEPDPLPEGRQYDQGRIRLASTFAVTSVPAESKSAGRAAAPKPGWFIYQPVELVASDEWLLTYWHEPSIFQGSDRVGKPGTPADKTALRRAVVNRWLEREGRNAGDLGTIVMYELSLSYAPAHRAIFAALENWELSLYQHNGTENITVLEGQLHDLWGARARLRDWVNRLNIPGAGTNPGKAWLPAVNHSVVEEVDERVNRALTRLAEMGEPLRGSFHVVQGRRTEVDKANEDRKRKRLEFFAALFLIPTFVVGLYGANTWVPGQGSHGGFWIMIVVIAVLTSLGLIILSRRDS